MFSRTRSKHTESGCDSDNSVSEISGKKENECNLRSQNLTYYKTKKFQNGDRIKKDCRLSCLFSFWCYDNWNGRIKRIINH